MAEEQKDPTPPPPPAEEEKEKQEQEREKEEEEEEEDSRLHHNQDNNNEKDQGRGRGGHSQSTMAHGMSSTGAYDPAARQRTICAAIAILLLLAGVTALILYLVYRPHKPRFSVVGAAVYNLNTTAPPLITVTVQFTIMTRNPNRRVSIYYDRLSAYVSYRNQAITPPLALPPLYQERQTTVAVSPVLGGTEVPVAAEVANGLAADEAYGVVGLRVVVTGRLRWKAGAIKTGHYGLYVRCDVVVGLRKGAVGQPPLLGSPGCKVDI